MKIVLAQIAPKLNREYNLQEHIKIIKENIKLGNQLIIFPELSLNGYLLMDSVYDNSFSIEELEIFKELSSDIDIILGCALKENIKANRKVFNTAIYFSDSKILNIHKKINLPNYGMFEEARFFTDSEKQNIDIINTSFGKTLTLICEDLWSSKNIDKIVSLEAEYIFVIANSPTRGFKDNGDLEIEEQWKAILKTVAILSKAYVIFVNRVGFEDGLGFWGKSRIINKNGNDVVILPFAKNIVKSIKMEF